MTPSELQNHLLYAAQNLRSSGRSFGSVVEIAYYLETDVFLRFHTSGNSPIAQIDLANRPPKILLYRGGKINGERRIRPSEDHLLTPAERFSIAHELGHWIAFTRLRFGPASDKQKYWEHEQAIDAFARCLLVPNWLVSQWLAQTPEGQPLPPAALVDWTKSLPYISEDVIAQSLARQRQSIGLLKLSSFEKPSHVPTLKVLISASGAALRLPLPGAHIHDSSLLNILRTASGSMPLQQLDIGELHLRDPFISWYRSTPSDPTWLSIATLTDNVGTKLRECDSCGTPLSAFTAIIDHSMPHSIFCSNNCCNHAASEATISSDPFIATTDPTSARYDDTD